MDRRARKIEQKRKQREATKKQAGASLARRPDANLVKVASGAPFGACYLSAGWDDPGDPCLVSAVVTRMLPGGRVVAGVGLVDRTCLGIKNGFLAEPMRGTEFERFLVRVGLPHGGMELCELLTVQSLVFHAIDYANRLGFKPHRDFPAALFGTRPETLTSTPWSEPKRALYMQGPEDDSAAILRQLTVSVGDGLFDHLVLGEAV